MILAGKVHPEPHAITINEVHTNILNRFREENIEIPFPQRDLHIRSGWDAGPSAGSRNKSGS